MKIDQIYYTRLDDGWGIAKATEGISEKFKNAFQSINAQNPADKTILSFDVFDGGYALSRSVPAGIDSFGRGKFFVHGYLFSELDSNEIFNNFGGLLNIKQFDENVDCDMIPISSLPLEEVKDRQLEKNKLPNLLECAYEAVLQNKKLEIKTSNVNNEDVLRLIMNVIYGYLPIYLRKFISFSSCIGGISRTITLTHEFSKTADITYDYEFNIANGISKTYIDIIERLINDRDNTISEIEKYIKNAISTVTLDAGEYKKAFDYVMFETGEAADKDDAISKLLDMLLEKKYSDASSAAYMSALINTCIKNNADISNSMHNMIMDAYFNTNQPELKGIIEKYIAYSYEKRCSEEDFEKLKVLKKENPDLHRMIYNTAIIGNADDLLRYVSLDVINNSDASDYIVGECNAGCRESVANKIAQLILESKDITYVDKIVERSMHKDVMEIVILKHPDKSIMWEYINCIFNDKSQYKNFSMGLSPSARTIVKNFCVNEINENTANILYAVWQTDQKLCMNMESSLNEKKKYKVIEKFYTQYLLEDMLTPEEVKNLCEHIINLRTKIADPYFTEDAFKEMAIKKYFSVSKRNCISRAATLKQIDELKDFGKLIHLSADEYATQLKVKFWTCFDYNDWQADEDYSKLYIQDDGNNNNDIGKKIYSVKVMSKLVTKITSHANIIGDTLKYCAISLLMEDSSPLNKKIRDLYINKLKEIVNSDVRYSSTLDRKRKIFNREFDYGNSNMIDFDIILLLNYSNEKGSLAENIDFGKLDILKRYINQCATTREKNMLSYPELFLSLYKIVFNRKNNLVRKSDSIGECNKYDDILRTLDKYAENFEEPKKQYIFKEIKALEKTIESSHYWWMSAGVFVALLLEFAVVFMSIDLFSLNKNVKTLLKVCIVIVGIIVAIVDSALDNKKRGNEKLSWNKVLTIVLWSVPGIAMFLTFLFAITTIV